MLHVFIVLYALLFFRKRLIFFMFFVLKMVCRGIIHFFFFFLLSCHNKLSFLSNLFSVLGFIFFFRVEGYFVFFLILFKCRGDSSWREYFDALVWNVGFLWFFCLVICYFSSSNFLNFHSLIFFFFGLVWYCVIVKGQHLCICFSW